MALEARFSHDIATLAFVPIARVAYLEMVVATTLSVRDCTVGKEGCHTSSARVEKVQLAANIEVSVLLPGL